MSKCEPQTYRPTNIHRNRLVEREHLAVLSLKIIQKIQAEKYLGSAEWLVQLHLTGWLLSSGSTACSSSCSTTSSKELSETFLFSVVDCSADIYDIHTPMTYSASLRQILSGIYLIKTPDTPQYLQPLLQSRNTVALSNNRFLSLWIGTITVFVYQPIGTITIFVYHHIGTITIFVYQRIGTITGYHKFENQPVGHIKGALSQNSSRNLIFCYKTTLIQ